ncbi:hypothetical protein TBR22_A09050 [Luteitalea sp. TBR-22]|uniref:hypothetical protein n=1 Tax=Luteitalea sp. TBR-22 TaxID=2802971 RepID=UPI001AFC9D6A|nr:hypothetical protein [Luteitalea sp. TBR-22]BCS31702.1 hypothetical protein TBR22_A09050 [Luteitalea sp. TBR-22]
MTVHATGGAPAMIVRAARQALAFLFLVAVGCGGGRSATPAVPVIGFTTVPPVAAGGPDRTSRIAGRVIGARPTQRVVLYAKAGPWWIQPLTAEPFTDIRPDGSWENTTHLGTEYAALLVDATFQPVDTIEALPTPGGKVVAVATVAGSGHDADPPKVLTFSGYEWQVRQNASDRGGRNAYHQDNAWVDTDGALHLRLAQRDRQWTSAEVILTRSLGYGTYAFTVRDTSTLDAAATLGMLVWDDEAADQNHRELDIEISRWGDPDLPNAQYVVQPYYVPANVARFSAPAGLLTHAFRWEPGRVSFQTTRGRQALGNPVVHRKAFVSGVPSPGAERVRMNLYYFRYAPKPPEADVEVVIERFHYLP